jgi:TonB family protein
MIPLAAALADEPPVTAAPAAAPAEKPPASTAPITKTGGSHPPRPTHTVSPVHPPALRQKLIGGECDIEALVSEQGHVVHTKVVSATQPEFGTAAEEAVRQWEFQPGERDGKPVATTVRIPFNFSFTPEEVLDIVAGRKVFRENTGTVIPAEQLPTWPQPNHIYLPAYPDQFRGSGKHGKVVVAIVVDEDGHVINPKIVKATYPEFVMPALITAVRLVYPPQKFGTGKEDHVCVSMEIQFDFRDPERLKKPGTDAPPATPPAKTKSD